MALLRFFGMLMVAVVCYITIIDTAAVLPKKFEKQLQRTALDMTPKNLRFQRDDRAGGVEQNGTGRAEQNGTQSAEQNGTQGAEQNGTQSAEQNGTQSAEQNGTQSAEQNGTQSAEQIETQSAEPIGTQSAEQNGTGGAEQVGTGGAEQVGTGGTERNGTERAEQNGTHGAEQNENAGAEQHENAGAVKNGIVPLKVCTSYSACAWRIYHETTRQFSKFFKHTCHCPDASYKCVKDYDQIGVSAWRFSCRQNTTDDDFVLPDWVD